MADILSADEVMAQIDAQRAASTTQLPPTTNSPADEVMAQIDAATRPRRTRTLDEYEAMLGPAAGRIQPRTRREILAAGRVGRPVLTPSRPYGPEAPLAEELPVQVGATLQEGRENLGRFNAKVNRTIEEIVGAEPGTIPTAGEVLHNAGRYTTAATADTMAEVVDRARRLALQGGTLEPTIGPEGHLANLEQLFSEAGRGGPPEPLPVEQDIQGLKQPLRTAARATYALAEMTPQIGAAAMLGPAGAGLPESAANFIVFGQTPEGFDPLLGGVMATAPQLGEFVSGVTGKILGKTFESAAREAPQIAGTLGATQSLLEQTIGGAAEVAWLMVAQAPDWGKMTPEEKEQSFLDNLALVFLGRAQRVPGLAAIKADEFKQDVYDTWANQRGRNQYALQQIGRLPTQENQPGIIAEGPTRTTVWKGPRPVPPPPEVTHATTEGPLTGGFPTEYERILAGQNVSPNAGPIREETGYQAGGGGGVRPAETQPINRGQPPIAARPDLINLPFEQRATEALRAGTIVPVEGINWSFASGDRPVVFMPIGAGVLPFYRSSRGTGGVKRAGEWQPFFGIGNDGWIIKGTNKQIANDYGNQDIRNAREWLNRNFNWPHELDTDLFFNPQRSPLNALGQIERGGHALEAILGDYQFENVGPDQTGQTHIRSVLDRITGPTEAELQPLRQTRLERERAAAMGQYAGAKRRIREQARITEPEFLTQEEINQRLRFNERPTASDIRSQLQRRSRGPYVTARDRAAAERAMNQPLPPEEPLPVPQPPQGPLSQGTMSEALGVPMQRPIPVTPAEEAGQPGPMTTGEMSRRLGVPVPPIEGQPPPVPTPGPRARDIREQLQRRSRGPYVTEFDRRRAEKAVKGLVAGSKAEQWANDVMNRPDVKKNKLIGYPLWGDAQRLSAAVVIGISHLERGIINFANWSKAMLRDIGKLSADDLKRLWDLSHTRLNWLMREPDWVKRDLLTRSHMQIGALHDEYDAWMDKNYSRQEAALLSQIQEHMKDANLPDAARMVFSNPQRFLEMVYRKRRVPKEYKDAVNVIRDLADQDPELKKAFDEIENSRNAFIIDKLKQLGYSGFEIQSPMTWKSSRANIYNRSPGLGLMIDEYMGYDGPETKNLPGYETLESGKPVFRADQLMDGLGLKAVRILNNPGRAIRNAMDEKGEVAGDTIGKWISQQLPEEWGIYKDLGFEDFLKSKPTFTLNEVQKWLMENGPKVEVRNFESPKSGPKNDYEVARDSIMRLRHEWYDTHNAGTREAIDTYAADYVNDADEVKMSRSLEALENRIGWTGKDREAWNEKLKEWVEAHKYVKFVEDGEIDPNLSTGFTYPTVAPSNLPIKVVMVRVPTSRSSDAMTREERAMQPDIFHQGIHFGAEDRNVLGWARIQMETTPDGRKIAHIIEQQDDLIDKTSDGKYYFTGNWTTLPGDKSLFEEAARKVKRSGNTGRAPSFATFDEADAALAKAWPITKNRKRTVLKAAIDQAIKDGATHIAVSDAPTAMMSEGHDTLAKWELVNPEQAKKVLAEKFPNIAKDFRILTRDEYKAEGGYISPTDSRLLILKRKRYGSEHGDADVQMDYRENVPVIRFQNHDLMRKYLKWKGSSKEFEVQLKDMQVPVEVVQRTPTEGGMRYNYDRALPELLRELTGDVGTKESFGEHMKAFTGGDEPGGGGLVPRGARHNLIFKTPTGEFKTDRSATVFGLEQAKQTLEQTGGASLIGRTLETGRVLAEEFGELDHLLKPGVTAEQLLNEVSKIAPEFRAVIEAMQEAGIKPRVVSVSSLKSPTTGKEVGGLYDRATNTIYLRRFANDQTGTFIEEMVHAATVEAYHNKSRAGESFRAELSQILKRLREKVHDPDEFYYLENELEMLAGAYVDPTIRKLMKSVMAEGGNTTLWSKFVAAVKNVWRSIFGGRTETILDRVLKLSQENFKPNEVLPKDMAALEGKLRDPNDRERLLAAHEAVRAGQGMEAVKREAASSLIGQNRAVQRTIGALKILSTQPLTPGEIQDNPALRDIKEASQRLLKQVDWMAREVEGMSWASDKLGGALQRFMDYRTNPNISEAEKSNATGQALKEMDEFNREYGKFRLESDKEEKTIKTDLEEAIKGHQWEIASTEAAKTLTEDLKQTGKAMAAAAQDKGAIALATKMASNTTALEHATQFIATFADHFLIQNGTIRTTKDLMSHLESIANRNGQTLEQAAGANRETVQYVADLVLKSEPYRQRLFEASDLFRDKSASYPLKPFMQKIAEHVEAGNYGAAMDAFGKGVGNTAVELNRSRKAARLFGRQVHNMVVRLREIQQLRQLYDAARTDPDFQAARNTVYQDLNVDAIMHGTDDTPTFRVKGIKPGDPDTTIDFGSTGKVAEENMAKWNDLKEKIANYLAHPEDPDYSPAKANALRKMAAQMELWANPTVNPRVSRLVPNFLDVLPNTFFGVLGKAGSVPDVIHRYLGGWGADYANATFTALRTVKQQVDAIQNVHIPRLESALKKAMKSHGMRSGDMRVWEDKIWTPLVASTQYFQNPLQHNKVGARLSTGHQVTAEDLIYLKRWREFDKALRNKLDQRNEASRSILKRFRSGVVEEAPEGGMRVRDAVETGPETVSRRIGGRIYQLAHDFLDAPTMAEKIRVLNANWDKLMAGYLEDSTGFSFRHSYRFHDEIKAAYLSRRQQGKTINNFHDLVDEIVTRYNNTHDGEPIEATDVVTALVPEIGGLFKKLLDEQKRLDTLKTRIKVFGGENAFNTARGEQIFPSTWYDYGSVSAADHAAHGGTSTSKFYFDHLKAVETLYRSLDKLVKDFESDQALLYNAKKAKQEGKNYYDYEDAKKARDLVGDYYNKLSSVLNEDVLRAIGERQGLVGAGMEYSLASILGGPAAMTFNTFGGLFNIMKADMEMTGRSIMNSSFRTGVRASWNALKGIASFMGTKENKVGRIIHKIVESGKGAPLINQFFKAYHDFLVETDQLRDRGREEGFSTASNMGEVRQAMWDWKVNGGAAGETPPNQSLLNKVKQSGVAGVKYLARAISNKTLRNVDSFLNELSKQLVQDIQQKFESRAIKYGTLRAEDARRQGRDPFDPTDIRNQFSADELMKTPGMQRNTTVEAAREREWFKRAADINIDARMMDYVKRREEARAAGHNPEEVRLFTPEERNQLMYAAATRVNLGDFGNRPLTFKAGKLGRYAGLLLGYRINQTYKMVSALDGLHKEPFFKRYKAAMPTFIMVLAAAAIWGAMGMQARSGVKQMMNQATGEPTVFGSQSGSDLANAMAVGAAQIMPLYGDIYNYATGNAYKTGWDLNNQFVLLNMATDVVKMMKQTWQSGDATYPMINFARRWTLPANWIGGYLPQVAGLQEFTNTRTYLNRAARDLGMETRLGKTSNFTGQNWGPTTPILNEFANAVGKGDTAGAKSAFDSLVRYYTDQGLDPKEARQRALSGIRTRNPLTQVFGSALTMGQLDQLYGRMNERERKIVSRALGNYETIVGQLGASTAMTKEARQTAKLRRVGRTARPTGIAGRIIGRATRAGRRVRNPLQRINRRLGIRQPRMKRTRTVIA